jgi:hypothetical protein
MNTLRRLLAQSVEDTDSQYPGVVSTRRNIAATGRVIARKTGHRKHLQGDCRAMSFGNRACSRYKQS